MKILWMLSLFALVARLVDVDAQTTCGSRQRKDWGLMSSTEKATYKAAIAAAMDSGAYIKFVEMHTEYMSELEAHQQCMFVYWHRLFLVAFENMLRGQGPQFACVTVPYFNWITASSRVTAGTCNSFGNCLSITKELGGFTSGSTRTLNINGVDNWGRCINVSPLDHFCQLSSTTGSACAKCVPRSDWSVAKVPTSAGYASVRYQVFRGKNIGEMAPLVEKGCHNNVHANLGSTMGTFASPADPIFWSHHAMVDLLHTIFHKCRVGTARLTFAQKAANTVAWTSCARRNGGIFNPTDSITMRTGQKGVNPISGRNDPKIGKYFTGVPSQFAGLMDIRDLGTSSYGYSISGQVATMYSQCDSSPTSRRLEEMTEGVDTNTTSKCSVAQDDDTDDYYSSQDTNQAYNGGDYISPDGMHVDGIDLPDNADGYERISQDDGHPDVVIVDPYPQGSDTGEPADDSEERVTSWYEQTMEAMDGDVQEKMADLERQACMFENQCLGGTEDYSPEFKALWKVTAPRCKIIVDSIINGSQRIIYESWREDMEAHFGCPQPTNSTYTTNSTYPIDANTTDHSTNSTYEADTTSLDSWTSSNSLEEAEEGDDTIKFSDVFASVEPTSDTTW